MQRGLALLLLAVILPVTAEAKPKRAAKRKHAARRLVSQKHISHPDAAIIVKSRGTTLYVLADFYGRIGDKTGGDGAGPRKKTDASTEIRSILCDAVDAHLFNIVLTPNFNRPHRNHFHLEVTGASWF